MIIQTNLLEINTSYVISFITKILIRWWCQLYIKFGSKLVQIEPETTVIGSDNSGSDALHKNHSTSPLQFKALIVTLVKTLFETLF